MADKKTLCPLRNDICLEDGTIVNNELVACRFWTHVVGINPQTGAQVDANDCAISWMPMLLIENSKETRAAAKEVETLRNEVIPQQQSMTGIMSQLLCNVTPVKTVGYARTDMTLIGDDDPKTVN